MQEYAYRKEFGLSYADMQKEPLEAYSTNNFIMNHIAELNRRANKIKGSTSDVPMRRPHIRRR